MDRLDRQLREASARTRASVVVDAVGRSPRCCAPDCFLTENDTASTPFRRVVDVRSSKPSTTSADVAEAHRRAAVGAQDDVGDLVDRANSPFVRSDNVLCPRCCILPPGRSRLAAASCSADDADRQPERFEPARIEIDLDLADLAAVDFDRRDAVDLLEQRLEVVLDHAAASCPTALRRTTAKRHDRQRGDVEADDRRVLDFFGQPAADGGHFLADLGRRRPADRSRAAARGRRRRSRLGRGRLDALHAVDAGDGILDRLRDERLDFLRRRAGIDRRDVDEREVDLGEEVDAEPRPSTRFPAP